MVSKITNTFITAVTPSTSSSIQDKWVINLSKKELTPEENFNYRKVQNLQLTQQISPSKYVSPLLQWQLPRQVNSMVLTTVASSVMSIEFLTPTVTNQYIQTSPKQNI